MNFQTLIPAKCILAGEHLILQRGFAIVAPVNKYHLLLKFTPNDIETIHSISGEGMSSMQILLWPVVRKALDLLNVHPLEIKGCFDIKSSIPPCGGLGFSAALCLAVAEWAVYYGLLPQDKLFEFAILLENMFHGKSSGLDIAGVMSKGVIQYYSNHEIEPLALKWRPKLYISCSGEQSFSNNCIKKVTELRKTDTVKANAIDDKMMSACMLVKQSLNSDYEQGLPLMISALNTGNECFYDWGLVSHTLHEHILEIKKHALSCKIVGAGFGGHVISLWKEKPPENLGFPLFALLR